MRYLLSTWVWVILLSVGVFSTNAQDKPIKLKFIETSDVHGCIFPFDFINNKTSNSSLANVYSYVKQQRAIPDQEVILLDDGDLLQGQPPVYYSNFYDTVSQHICASVMNFMKYDAAAVGNHDIEAGHAVYDRLVKQFGFPWLGANVVVEGTDNPYFKPYSILNRHGVKIAILGLCTPGVPDWLPKNLWSGMQFDDMIKSARKWVGIIQQKEHPDLIVGLFHAGVDETYDSHKNLSEKNPNASRLVAEQVDGFDFILTGHDHKLGYSKVKSPSGNRVIVTGPSGHCQTAVSVTVTLASGNPEGKYLKTFKMDTVLVNQYPPDSGFNNTFSAQQKVIADYVSEKVGSFTETISTKPSLLGDSKFVDLIHAIQMELTGARVSFAAPLGFAVTIRKGDIYMRDMFNLYKYENFLYKIKMTGNEIKNYLEYSYSHWMNKMTDSTGQLIKFKKDASGNLLRDDHGKALFETNPYNFENAAGINYTVNLDAKYGDYITISGLSDGTPFYPDSVYSVAINSYRASGGGGLITNGAGIGADELPKRIVSSTDIDLRYYLKAWIKNKGIITPSIDHNWKVIPENWYQATRQHSSLELFNTVNIGQ